MRFRIKTPIGAPGLDNAVITEACSRYVTTDMDGRPTLVIPTRDGRLFALRDGDTVKPEDCAALREALTAIGAAPRRVF